MTRVVLDCSAILAFLLDEPGADVVEASLPTAAVSTVNVAEAISKLVERGAGKGVARRRLRALALEVLVFDLGQAEESGEMRRTTKTFGLSLADRACLALASKLGVPVLTGDRVWAKLDVGVEVRLFR